MIEVKKNAPPTAVEMQNFMKEIDFPLSPEFVDFFSTANGADVFTGERYIFLWPITEMKKNNDDYEVPELAPEFFLIGHNGGDGAYGIEKKSGKVYQLPFLELSDDLELVSDSFQDFIYGTQLEENSGDAV